MPLQLLRDENYKPVRFEINLPESTVLVQVWIVQIGRVMLYLMDTFLAENAVEDRRITDILYGGDHEKRIKQEIILGIGGTRLIKKLGHNIKAFHLNEGHSAFLCFERIRNYMKENKVSYNEAKNVCYYSNIFTTHTPVPAGIDIFTKDLFVKYFRKYAEEEVGVSVDELFLEGDLNKDKSDNNHFNMAYLAINNSHFINGVSKLHGEVSRKMWMLSDQRSKIESITNGVHTASYLSYFSNAMYCKYFTKDYIYDEHIWNRIDEISDEDIWTMRLLNKFDLISFARQRITDKWIILGAEKDILNEAKSI